MALIANEMTVNAMDVGMKRLATNRTNQTRITIKINQIATTNQTV